jgi:hypothetical protein
VDGSRAAAAAAAGSADHDRVKEAALAACKALGASPSQQRASLEAAALLTDPCGAHPAARVTVSCPGAHRDAAVIAAAAGWPQQAWYCPEEVQEPEDAAGDEDAVAAVCMSGFGRQLECRRTVGGAVSVFATGPIGAGLLRGLPLLKRCRGVGLDIIPWGSDPRAVSVALAAFLNADVDALALAKEV